MIPRTVRSTVAALNAALLLGLTLRPDLAFSEPYIAIQHGLQCIVCHVNPTGGGMRNAFGDVFAETTMPAITPAGAPIWTGQIVQDFVRVGGDLRTDWSRTTTPQSPTQVQVGLEQARLYGDVSVIPNRLALYVDELIAPGAAETMEAYAIYGDTSRWYLKAGQFYLPFGWRLQDQTAFVRQVTGINMNVPNDGIELGLQRPNWSGQLDIARGVTTSSAAASSASTSSSSTASLPSTSGYQVTGQLIYVLPRWRLGAAGSFTQAPSGNREMGGLFAGLRTGPVAWLGEADLVRQAGYPDGTRSMVPLLGEIDWALLKGHNLKLTSELYDPELSVANNQQTRWSVVYEYTPIPFLQARAGFRRYQGIPQNNAQNQTLTFVEVHGFF